MEFLFVVICLVAFTAIVSAYFVGRNDGYAACAKTFWNLLGQDPVLYDKAYTHIKALADDEFTGA